MENNLKINSFLVAGLAIAFYFTFMFMKHSPALSPIIPFAEDPYDAIGSFAVLLSPFLVLLCLVRAFRPYPSGTPSAQQKMFLVRSQVAIPLAVLETLMADGIAMIRYPQLWVHAPATSQLLALMGAVMAFSVGVLLLVRRTAQTFSGLPIHYNRRALVFSLIFVILLGAYPTDLHQSVAGEILTLFISILLFFIPLSALIESYIPYTMQLEPIASVRSLFSKRWIVWGVIICLGAGVGVFLLIADQGEGGGGSVPITRLLTVASIFIGTTTVAAIIGFFTLRYDLGLFGSRFVEGNIQR
jgi:hypothetical protein